MKTTTLENWVTEKGGPDKVAEILEVTPSAVRVWLRGEGTPRVKTISEIISLSNGRLTFGGIVRETDRNRK